MSELGANVSPKREARRIGANESPTRALRVAALGLGVLLALVACEERTVVIPRDAGDASTIDAGEPIACTAGLFRCSGSSAERCLDDGTWSEPETCDALCDARSGCVVCVPDTRRCDGDVSSVCTADGSGWVPARDCAEWDVSCGADGFCDDACAAVERAESYLGCEYVAVTLPNYILEPSADEFRDGYEVRLVLTHPDDPEANPERAPATVRVEHGDEAIATVTIEPGELAEVVLPYVTTASLPTPGAAWSSTVARGAAYRVRSDRPIAAAQFSPFEYARDFEPGEVENLAFSNDASLLLPVNALGSDHVVPSWEPLQSVELELPGYLAIVGASRSTTTVRAFGRGPLALASGGESRAIEGGVELTLGFGDVAILLTVSTRTCTDALCGDGDPSGARVESDRPVAVFGGHWCANVPSGDKACDHLEEQLPPTDRLGVSYTGTALLPPEVRSFNVIRVFGTVDDTEVTVRSPDAPDQFLRIDRGRFEEARVRGAFEVVANRPVLVAQYMTGATLALDPEGGRLDLGDPSLTFVPAREQYRSDYAFVAPRSYGTAAFGQVHVALDRAPGAAIYLDEVRIDDRVVWAEVGGREVGVLEVDTGVHALRSDDSPFGATLFGMGTATSFAYPVGLDLPRVF